MNQNMQSNENSKPVTLEDLAVMVANGFEQVGKDIEGVKGDIEGIKADIKRLEVKIDALSSKLTAHLELSDKRYLELKRRDMIMARWVKQIADKTGVQIDLAELDKF